MRNLKSVNLIWISLILSLLFVILPLFKPYVSGTADGLGHRFRLVSFYNSLKEGNIRPRWANEAALGYGAPIFLFNYPLPYYLGSLFLFLGFSVNQSGQILASASLFLSGFFMFLLGRKLYGNLAGLVAAIVYTYAPYHLQMTYLYDSWGEEVAFVFPPLIVYLILKLNSSLDSYLYQTQSSNLKAQNQNLKLKTFSFKLWLCTLHFALCTFVWFLFILSHNVSVLMFTPMILLLGFVMDFERPRLAASQGVALIKSFMLALTLSAFFWLPAAVLQNEMKYPLFLITEGGMRGSFFKSFSFQWETAFRVMKSGSTGYLDFTIGLPILLIIIAGSLHIIRSKIKDQRSKPSAKLKAFNFELDFALCTLIFALFSLYLTNYLSNWVWNMPPFTYILYPFRFLFVASFAGALLGGLVVKKNWLLAVAIIIFSIVQGRPYLNPYTDIYPFPDTYFYQNQTVTAAPMTKKNMLIKEFLPKYSNDDFLVKQEGENSKYKEAFFKNEKGKITVNYLGAEKLSLNVDTEKEDDLIINRLYFPNWEIRVNGVLRKANIDEAGRMMVAVPAGSHKIELQFGISGIEKWAYIISIAGTVILLFEALTKYRIRGILSRS